MNKKISIVFVLLQFIVFSVALILVIGIKENNERKIANTPTQTPIENKALPTDPVVLPQEETDTQIVKQPAVNNNTKVKPAPKANVPYRLQIPKLGINATIESVGLDPKGRMDVPKNFFSVGLYSLGFKPGDNGSSVISGHYDTVSGNPAVFFKIGNLVAGDQIIVTNEKSEKLTFVVSEVQNYLHDQLPMDRIFATTGRPGLNLITCAGSWDKASNNYSNRIVVYAIK